MENMAWDEATIPDSGAQLVLQQKHFKTTRMGHWGKGSNPLVSGSNVTLAQCSSYGMICNRTRVRALLIEHIRKYLPSVVRDLQRNRALQALQERLTNEDVDGQGDSRDIIRLLYYALGIAARGDETRPPPFLQHKSTEIDINHFTVDFCNLAIEYHNDSRWTMEQKSFHLSCRRGEVVNSAVDGILYAPVEGSLKICAIMEVKRTA